MALSPPPSPQDHSIPYLVSIIQELSLARSLETVMAIVRRAARMIARADGSTFVLREGNFCFYADEDAIGPLWKGQRFPIESCISGWSMLHRESVIIPDIYRDARIPQDAYRPTFVKSLTMVPIRAGAPIGAIGTYWSSHHVSGEEEVRLLQALADTASVAIENVRLYSRLESQILELESASRAKDEFLMTLSHELRTPLTAILGWSEQLLAEPPEDRTFHTGLETIVRNAKLQARIVDDLLDTTRILSGKLTLERRETNLPEITRLTVQSLTPAAEKKGVRIVPSIPSEIRPFVGDPARLEQALRNLVSNAVKFTPKNGTVEVSLLQDSTWARIQVKDTGEGIDSKFLPHLFDRFRQADGSLTRRHGGLGLGLAIAKHIIEAHQGSLRAESEGPGKGAIFEISLPTAAPAFKPPGIGGGNGGTQTLTGLKILAIDDDQDSRILIEHVLRKNGGEVRSAGGADEGRKTLENFTADVIVCDLSMPGEDGLAFIRKLRSTDGPNRRVPAIAFTAFADRFHEELALDSGFDSFLAKPLRSDQLVTKVLQVHRISAVEDQSAAVP